LVIRKWTKKEEEVNILTSPREVVILQSRPNLKIKEKDEPGLISQPAIFSFFLFVIEARRQSREPTPDFYI
jgi:hypothetical protein